MDEAKESIEMSEKWCTTLLAVISLTLLQSQVTEFKLKLIKFSMNYNDNCSHFNESGTV